MRLLRSSRNDNKDLAVVCVVAASPVIARLVPTEVGAFR